MGIHSVDVHQGVAGMTWIVVAANRPEDARAFVHGAGVMIGVQRDCQLVDNNPWIQPSERWYVDPASSPWRRITRKGLYQGDLALYDSYNEKTNHVIVLVVPRLSKSARTGKRKISTTPPPPALFNPDTAVDLTHDFAGLSLQEETQLRREKAPQLLTPNFYRFDKALYNNGLRELTLRPHQITPEPLPSKDEQVWFDRALANAFLRFGPRHDWNSVVWYRSRDEETLIAEERASTLRIGENVEVICGEYQGMYGTVEGVNYKDVHVKIIEPVQVVVTFAARDIRPCFVVGDGVKVIGGILRDQTGYVVAVDDDIVTISCLGSVVVPGSRGNSLLDETSPCSNTQPTAQLDRIEVGSVYSSFAIVD
jgi:transcription antitermination factor NusG